MSIADILLLTTVCLAFGAFMVAVACAAWFCQQALLAFQPAPRKATVRIAPTRR